MSQGEHSAIQTELAPAINQVLHPDRIGKAYIKLCCTFGGRSIVPDIAVFQWERIPRKADGSIANAFELAPDWTIEILSPDQSQTRVTRNILHCMAHGTQMGWLLDPAERSAIVYSPEQLPVFYDNAANTLPVPRFAVAMQLTIGELFGWLME